MNLKSTIHFILLLLLLTASSLWAVEYGNAYTFATNKYYTQQTSNVGKMIARDPLAGTHIVWTDGASPDLFAERSVRYAFCDDDSGAIADQLEANQYAISQGTNRSAYVNIELIPFEDDYLAACFYYGDTRAMLGVDLFRGTGVFSEVEISQGGNILGLAPRGTVDTNGTAHLASALSDVAGGGHASFDVTLWNGEPDEWFAEWDISDPIEVESCAGVSHRIQANRTGSEVALAWHHNLIGVPAVGEWAGTTEHTLNNDLFIYESPDGEEWEWDDVINVTRTIGIDRELDGDYAYGDTLRPYDDVDLIYVDDVLHAVFTTRGFKMDLTNENSPPVESYTTRESLIWHWDAETDSLTLVADGWYENDGELNGLHSNVNRPSIGADEDGKLYCIFRQVTEDDLRDNFVCAGEIMLSMSEDGGETWSEAINLTGTLNESEDETDYNDENFPSLAEYVDDDLHIFYQLTPDMLDDDHPNHMVYQRVPVADLPDVDPLEMPREGFQYHNRMPVSVSVDDSALPHEFAITSIHPNPFNSTTRVSYSIPTAGNVTLKLFDINGRGVTTLFSGEQAVGVHEYTLESRDLSAGVYYLQLSNTRSTSIRKLVNLR